MTDVFIAEVRRTLRASRFPRLSPFGLSQDEVTRRVAAATDGLTRLFGIPGRTASAVRRFGISAVNAIPPLKDRFMAEARGESGELPSLLRGALV